MFGFFLQLLSKTFPVVEDFGEIVINAKTSLPKVPRYSCQILIKLEFSGHIFEKKLKYQVSSKSVQWESFHADEDTDEHDEATVAFRKFATATKSKE